MYGAINITMIINTIFIIIIRGRIEKNSFLLFLLSSDINLDKANGREKLLRLINRIKVGNINIYIPSPLVPIILAINIFISIPNILVISAPNIKSIVDLKKLYFIVKFIQKKVSLF